MNQPSEGRDIWSADVVLNDGGTVHLRPINPTDTARLQEFHSRQPAESQYYRYFSAKATLTDAEATRFTNVDLQDRGALVVEDGDDFIAWASYERFAGRDDADVAFHVDEHHLKRGIATILLEHLSTMAKAAGITRFTAEVLAENRGMARVFRHAGWDLTHSFESGVIDYAWSLEDTPTLISNIARREQVADAMSMARFMAPRSVAVIGASSHPGSVGRAALEIAIASCRDRTIWAINPHPQTILGLPTFASIDDIAPDEPIDMAVIAVPESALADVLGSCARRRVRGAVVLTGVGSSFPIADVVREARRFGMRIVGPGSMGIAASTTARPVQSHLAPTLIPTGPLALSVQSGSLGASMLERAVALGVGVGGFVSLGDKADVSGNDLLQFWDDDPAIKVIAMYTESFGNPRRFARIARRVGENKPIVAVRSDHGRFDDALYQQAGVIRVDTVRGMLDTARVLALQPVPRGGRVAVISNSASPARLLLAELANQGLAAVPPPQTPATPTGSANDWQQVGWSMDLPSLAQLVNQRRTDGSCDSIVVIYAPPTAPHGDGGAARFVELLQANSDIPLVMVVLGRNDGVLTRESSIPTFAFPDDAARVLGRAAAYSTWRTEAVRNRHPADRPISLRDARAHGRNDVADEGTRGDQDRIAVERRDAAMREVIDHALELRPTGTLLPLTATTQLLAALDVPFADGHSVATVAAATAAADRLGYPVALKANQRPNKGRGRDAGVALDLASPEALTAAWAEIDVSVGGLREATVQRIVPSGIECRIHATLHRSLGPIVAFGLGGTFAESLDDRTIRLAPLEIAEAHAMITGTQASEVLADLGADVAQIASLLVAVGAAMDRHDDLFEIDLNPIVVSATTCWVTDASIRVRPPTAPDLPTRRLG